MIVLDTNVVSEVWRPQPSAAVIAWLDAQPADSLYLCTPVLAELRYGIALLEHGARRTRLLASVDRLETETYRDRILHLDTTAAAEYGRLAAERQRTGHRIRTMDGLVAAVALVHRAGLATRDFGDFAGLGLDVVNPFEAAIPVNEA